MLCTLVAHYQCFVGTCFLQFFYLKVETAHSSEMILTSYQITRCHIPDDNTIGEFEIRTVMLLKTLESSRVLFVMKWIQNFHSVKKTLIFPAHQGQWQVTHPDIFRWMALTLGDSSKHLSQCCCSHHHDSTHDNHHVHDDVKRGHETSPAHHEDLKSDHPDQSSTADLQEYSHSANNYCLIIFRVQYQCVVNINNFLTFL